MLEPLAATVLNSVLPSRPLATQFFASRSAFGMAVRTAAHALPHDFFTPHPSGVKGKGKALPEDEHGLSSISSVKEGTRCSGVVHETTTPSTPRTLSTRQRIRRSSGHRCLASGSGSHVPSLRTWSRQVQTAQRRHASTQPTASPPIQHPPASPEERQKWTQTFKDVAKGGSKVQPEVAWQAFASLLHHNRRAPGPPTTALAFLTNLATSVVREHLDTLSAELLQRWGSRLQEALHHIDPGIQDVPRNLVKVRWNMIHSVALAMLGNLDGALDALAALSRQLEPLNQRYLQGWIVQSSALVLPALYQYSGPRGLADWLLKNRQFHEILVRRSEEAGVVLPADFFSQTAYSLLSRLDDPVGYLEQVSRTLSRGQTAVWGSILIRATSRSRRDTYALLQLLQKMSLTVPAPTIFVVVKDLARAGSFDEAKKLLASVPSKGTASRPGPGYLSTALFVAARQGDTEAAERHYTLFAQHYKPGSDDKATYMHAYAVAGNPGRVVELFHEFFPPSSKDDPRERPNIVHYTTVMFAYSQVGDLNGVNHWLGELSRVGVRPDLHVYSVILQSFASQGDVDSMITLLDQMRDSGVYLTRFMYTTLIATLADRQDPLAAERLYKRAVNDGIVPDVKMVVSIMNAHVEAGSWHGVIRAFDYLNTPGRPGAAMTIGVYNTLMKAYVLIGAPFRIVVGVFRQLGAANVTPDARTFALLIQSACDSGFMDIAEDLYQEMERLAAEDGRTELRANVYVLTIILRGYLLTGRRMKAKEVLDRMKEKGLRPNAITYAGILKAYSEQSLNQGTVVAEEFLQSLVKDDDRPWLQSERGRRLVLETVYRPLLHAYVLKESTYDVERLHAEMTDAGGEPTLGTLTALLDVHRRTGDIDGVRTIWPQIHRLGLEYARLNSLLALEETSTPNLSGHGAVMCIPLSVYIDALSAAGEHAEVAHVWKKLKDEGLQFDSHNWNHLVTALVRAGEPHRAFDIVENVILKYQEQIRRRYAGERDAHPASPLTLDLPPAEEGELPPPRPEARLRSGARRSWTVERATRRMRHVESGDEAGSADFAHPLHILQQLSPLWNTWRPHGATLTLLGQVLEHLRAGRLVQPLRPGVDQHYEQAALNAEEVRQRTKAAGQVLGGIYDAFPRTVQLIREYELMRGSSRRGSGPSDE
ncbi:hypothetical protein C8Q77DRAFT_1188084 [Trametes polyzona]|nr:hypothetical protein C8Q77DRAFT_1188084 [Trametes polyzona]